MKSKPYPEYEDSGVEWIGMIPNGWNVEKLKFNSKINKKSLPENKDPNYEFFYLDISNVSNNGTILNIELMRFEDAPSRARRIPNNQDTIISTVRTYLKAIAYLNDIPENFIVSTGFSVLNPENNVFPRYLYYLVSSDLFVQTVVAYSKGIAYPAINSSDLANLPIWYPDIETQHKITSFLDKKISEIDLTIEKDTHLIELLKEKRTALINHVVTKGLDPTVKMKDSGVEWIGEIPEDWEIRKFSHIADSIVVGYVGSIESFYTDENNGVPLLKTGNVDYGELNLDNLHYVTRDFHLMNKKSQLKPGDIVIARHGESGRSSVVPTCMGEANCLNIVVLKSSSEMDGNYYSYVLNSHLIQEHLQAIQGGAVQGVINTEDISFLKVFHPPLLQQKKIAKYLKLETTKIEKIISKIQDKISFLDEYKKSLIHHVVTGKVNVTKED